jgi:hypothetical protein
MVRSSFIKISSALFISIAMLVVGMVFGNPQSAVAASSQNHDFGILNAADVAAYRWESSASYFMSHQAWPQNLTSFSSADISAYRWTAMAAYYGSHPEFSSRNLTTFNAADISAYRWEAMASYYVSHQNSAASARLLKNNAESHDFRLVPIEPGFWTRQ